MTPSITPLRPFGLEVSFAPGTPWSRVDTEQVRAWVDQHRVVLLRGLEAVEPHTLAAEARRLGPLQPWRFGAVHELKQDPKADNYLYTEHAVPLHWDGAFAARVPHWLVFHCVRAPSKDAGGETVFVDTPSVLARATAEQRACWASARVRYRTEKKAHYGGTFVSPIVARHPTLGVEVIRYAEPVEDLNPVSVQPLGDSAQDATQLMQGLSRALAHPDSVLSVPWVEGDVVIVDNHALLHGRRAFRDGSPRHLRRVNILDPDRSTRALLEAAWRVRRPEFYRAELPILLIPALLTAGHWRELLSLPFLAGVAVFFLMFNVGDMVNCWLDRDADLHRKTHLAEAVTLLGPRSLSLQIAGSVLLAVALCLYLAASLKRDWLAGAGVLGSVLAWQYTAPPLRLKSRGLLQVASYVVLLFVGPMVLVSGLFVTLPPLPVIAVALSFGAMQSGILLVNNAEDLDEDERVGTRTASSVLGARGAITFALALVTLGGTLLAAMLGILAGGIAAVAAAAPLTAVIAWNAAWLKRLRDQMIAAAEPEARARLRKEGKHVPRRIEAGAWAALFGAAAVFLLRGGGG